MKKVRNYIAVRISNAKKTIQPEDVDMVEIACLLSDVEKLLFPQKITTLQERPKISYIFDKKLAKHLFHVPQAILCSFDKQIAEIARLRSIKCLSVRQQEAIFNLQTRAKKQNYQFEFSNSLNEQAFFIIDWNSDYQTNQNDFYESDFVLYGEIYQQGGLETSLLIKTEDYGRLQINATKEQIIANKHILYKQWGINVKGKRRKPNCEPYDLELIDFFGEYNPIFDKNTLDKAIKNAFPTLEKMEDVNEIIVSLKTEYL